MQRRERVSKKNSLAARFMDCANPLFVSMDRSVTKPTKNDVSFQRHADSRYGSFSGIVDQILIALQSFSYNHFAYLWLRDCDKSFSFEIYRYIGDWTNFIHFHRSRGQTNKTKRSVSRCARSITWVGKHSKTSHRVPSYRLHVSFFKPRFFMGTDVFCDLAGVSEILRKSMKGFPCSCSVTKCDRRLYGVREFDTRWSKDPKTDIWGKQSIRRGKREEIDSLFIFARFQMFLSVSASLGWPYQPGMGGGLLELYGECFFPFGRRRGDRFNFEIYGRPQVRFPNRENSMGE